MTSTETPACPKKCLYNYNAKILNFSETTQNRRVNYHNNTEYRLCSNIYFASKLKHSSNQIQIHFIGLTFSLEDFNDLYSVFNYWLGTNRQCIMSSQETTRFISHSAPLCYLLHYLGTGQVYRIGRTLPTSCVGWLSYSHKGLKYNNN